MLTNKLRELLSIDRRSLALMRALLGAFLLVDLSRRAAQAEAFYSDFGALPRAAIVEPGAELHWSLHALSGAVGFELALFAVAALAAVALIVGWRTRAATLVLWVLTVSLHNRAESVLISGDKVLRMVLFWSLFLPLGDRWSLDARRGRRSSDDTLLFSIAGAALLLQVVAIYPATVYHKLQHRPWQDLSIVGRMLDVDGITSPLGRLLRRVAAIFPALTIWTLATELVAPLVALFKGGKVRAFAVLVMIGFHVVLLGTTLILGLFPFIMAVAWSVFLPSWFWEVALPRCADKLGRLLPVLRQPLASCGDWLRALDGAPAGANGPGGRATAPGWGGHLERILTIVSACFAAIALIDFASSAGGPRGLRPVSLFDAMIETLRLDATRGWELFPTVMTNRYYVYAARLGDGSRIDLHKDGAPLDWEHPRNRSENNIWWKYQLHLDDHAERYAPSFSWFLAAAYERDHPDRAVETIDIVMLERPYGVSKREPLRKVSLWHEEIVGSRVEATAPGAKEDWQVGDRVSMTFVFTRETLAGGACASDRDLGEHHCSSSRPDSRGPSDRDPASVLRPLARENGAPVLAAGDAGTALPAGATRGKAACVYTVEGRIPKPRVRWEADGPWFSTKTDWYTGAISGCHPVSGGDAGKHGKKE